MKWYVGVTQKPDKYEDVLFNAFEAGFQAGVEVEREACIVVADGSYCDVANDIRARDE